MERFGDFFPENPQTLDELLEQMAQRMAAMQAMLNSMTPEQRAQLQELCRAAARTTWTCAGRWTSSASTCARMFPQMGWDQSLRLPGPGPARARPRRCRRCSELGDLDQLENLLRGATNPGALAEADMDRVRDLLGDDAARSLERLAELTRCSRRPGSSSRQGGPARADAARASGAIGSNALARPVPQAHQGPDRPAPARPPRASATSGRTTPSRTSTAIRSTSTCSARSATPLAAQRAAARRCASRPTTSRSSAPSTSPARHGADARPVAVDADARQLPAGEEGGDGAALADLARSSRATTSASSGSARRRGCSSPSSCPR